jgi:hypothetical protein
VGVEATIEGNDLSGFPPDQLTIVYFCDACDHRADLDWRKVPDGMTVQELRQHLPETVPLGGKNPGCECLLVAHEIQLPKNAAKGMRYNGDFHKGPVSARGRGRSRPRIHPTHQKWRSGFSDTFM